MSGLGRRQFVQGVGVAGLGLLAGCVLPSLQRPEPARVPRLGFLGSGLPDADFDGFREGLRELGYVEGQNVTIEYRGPADGVIRAEELSAFAAELVALPVDVLVAGSLPQTGAAKAATTTIPIVFVFHPDPVGYGHVASLGRPGGNITGTSFLAAQLSVKRLELLRDAMPGLARVAVLSPFGDPVAQPMPQEVQAAADTMGLHVQLLSVRTDEELEPALNMALQGEAQAFMTMPGPNFPRNAQRIGQFAAEHRLPVMSSNREAAARNSGRAAQAGAAAKTPLGRLATRASLGEVTSRAGNSVVARAARLSN